MKAITRTLTILLALVLICGVLPAAPAQAASSAWDGTTIDVSWYNKTDKEFYISTPEQLMGLAAIVNGIYNTSITKIIGDASCIEDKTATGSNNGTSNNLSTDVYHYGADDFNGKTIYLTADLDMGGRQNSSGIWSGPNYMPIGGQYLMEKNDPSTKLGSSFCGNLNGQGHTIYNIYCERHCSTGNYGDGQSVGLIGRLGVHDNDPVESRPTNPTVSNLAVTGAIKGNRSVGGIVGKIGKTNGGAIIENCANFATVSNTDAKGCGGIVGAAWNGGVIRNCYNAGAVSTSYVCPTGGIAGSNEITIENCYNVGQISAARDSYAMGIGTNNGGGTEVDNCYFLASSAPGGGYYGKTNGTVTGMTEAEMKADDFLTKLGGAFVADTGNINNGYPILSWQAANTGESAAWTNPYTDVAEGSWYYDSVRYVTEQGLFSGVGSDQFAPDTKLSRAMLATVLWRMAGEPSASTNTPFTDVATSAWYADAAVWAYESGIVTGTSATTFSPNADITREQLATMLYRYAANVAGANVSQTADLTGYTDAGSVAGYAKNAVAWAVGAGIITGTSSTTLSPAGTATRAQAATMLMRLDAYLA